MVAVAEPPHHQGVLQEEPSSPAQRSHGKHRNPRWGLGLHEKREAAELQIDGEEQIERRTAVLLRPTAAAKMAGAGRSSQAEVAAILNRERERSRGKERKGKREKRGTDRGGPRVSDKRGCHPGEIDQPLTRKINRIYPFKRIKQLKKNSKDFSLRIKRPKFK